MALVFISHAHRDEALARKIAALLGDALGLSPSDFFLSSQAGHGVAPAESIRASIMGELRAVPAMVVLVTPEASSRPWVWLEAGNRLGGDKPSPIFVVPSTRLLPLLAPVADLRCLRLDNDGELHELVRAIGQCLGKPPLDFLSYTPALEEVAQRAARAYSPWAERWASVTQHPTLAATILLLMAVPLGVFLIGARSREALQDELTRTRSELMRTQNELMETEFSLNAGALENASRVYLLKGAVLSSQGSPVHEAGVMVSHREVRDVAACEQSDDCTSMTTLTDGTFTLDLSDIGAAQDDEVVLSVSTPGFRFYSTRLTVDVRATNAGNAPQNIRLTEQ